MNEIRLGEKLGSGAENTCYFRSSSNGDSPNRDNPTVVKTYNRLGKIWQNQGPTYIERCLAVFADQDIPIINIEIHDNPVLVMQDGSRKQVRTAIETPFLEDVPEKTLQYRDLTDPKIGPEMLRFICEFLHKTNEVYHEEKLGLDPCGGGILVDVFKSAVQTATLNAAKLTPRPLRERIEDRIKGVKGQIRNLIRMDGEIMLIDSGMHNLSPEGKFKFVTSLLHHLSTGGLIEIIRHANAQLPKEVQIPEEEIDALPFNGTETHRRIGLGLAKLMIPMFERYEAQRETRSEQDPTSLTKNLASAT